MQGLNNIILCGMCEVPLKPIDFFLTDSTIRTGLDWIATQVCEKKKIEGGEPEVCKGAVDMMASRLLPAVADGILSSQRICDEYLGFCKTPKITELNADDYVKQKIAEKPASIKDNNFVDNIYKQIKESKTPRKTVRSVQLSDPHIDFSYKEGEPSTCNFPICCRDNGPNQVSLDPSKTAGKWGDYNCDIPYATLENMFEFIAKNIKLDFMTWVGDNSGHNVWDNTNEEVAHDSVTITNGIKKILPNV